MVMVELIIESVIIIAMSRSLSHILVLFLLALSLGGVLLAPFVHLLLVFGSFRVHSEDT